jgi:hypothetical protein
MFLPMRISKGLIFFAMCPADSIKNAVFRIRIDFGGLDPTWIQKDNYLKL